MDSFKWIKTHGLQYLGIDPALLATGEPTSLQGFKVLGGFMFMARCLYGLWVNQMTWNAGYLYSLVKNHEYFRSWYSWTNDFAVNGEMTWHTAILPQPSRRSSRAEGPGDGESIPLMQLQSISQTVENAPEGRTTWRWWIAEML